MHLLPLDEYAYDQLFVFKTSTAGSAVKSYTSTVLQVGERGELMLSVDMQDRNYQNIQLITHVIVLVHMCYNDCYLIELLVAR